MRTKVPLHGQGVLKIFKNLINLWFPYNTRVYNWENKYYENFALEVIYHSRLLPNDLIMWWK